MHVPQQLLYFFTCEVDKSTGKFQSCCLGKQVSGYKEEKADVSPLVKEGWPLWKLWEWFLGKEMEVKIWLSRLQWEGDAADTEQSEENS